MIELETKLNIIIPEQLFQRILSSNPKILSLGADGVIESKTALTLAEIDAIKALIFDHANLDKCATIAEIKAWIKARDLGEVKVQVATVKKARARPQK